MPDISQANLRQWCVVWEKSDTSTSHGQPRVESPVNVRCRWVTAERASVTQEGTTESYPLSVPIGRSFAVGSYVWGPGKIADLPVNPQYYEITGFDETPDLKARHPAYVASLQKASKTLPTVV